MRQKELTEEEFVKVYCYQSKQADEFVKNKIDNGDVVPPNEVSSHTVEVDTKTEESHYIRLKPDTYNPLGTLRRKKQAKR